MSHKSESSHSHRDPLSIMFVELVRPQHTFSVKFIPRGFVSDAILKRVFLSFSVRCWCLQIQSIFTY